MNYFMIYPIFCGPRNLTDFLLSLNKHCILPKNSVYLKEVHGVSYESLASVRFLVANGVQYALLAKRVFTRRGTFIPLHFAALSSMHVHLKHNHKGDSYAIAHTHVFRFRDLWKRF